MALLSASEFRDWDEGSDAVHELIDGVPVVMPLRRAGHAQIVGNLLGLADAAVQARRPCRALPGVGLVLAEGPPGAVYAPDLLVTCEPIASRHWCQAPRLVAEVLPPFGEGYDKRFKLPAYAALPSVEELWLVDSRVRLVQVWQRIEGSWRDGLPIIGRGGFVSHILGVEVTLDAVYALTALEPPPDEPLG